MSSILNSTYTDYVVQGHRYDIIEGYGCRPTTYFSIPALFIVWIPPMVISLATFAYSALAFRHFMKRRTAFSSHLTTLRSSLTTTRYLRLIAMSAVQMVISLAFSAYTLWFTATSVPMRPWTTWADVHSDFLRVDQYPDALVPPEIKRAYYVLWWLIPVSTLIFIGFFSFGRDARTEYNKFFTAVRSKALRTKSSKEPAFETVTIQRPKPIHVSTLSRSLQSSNITLPIMVSFPNSQSSKAFSSQNTTRSSEIKQASNIYYEDHVLERFDSVQV